MRGRRNGVKVVLLGFFTLLLTGALQNFKPGRETRLEALARIADEKLLDSKYEAACSVHETILSLLPDSESRLRARHHFLAGSSLLEPIRRESGPSAKLERAVSHFKQASEIDPTEWGAYSVPATLAWVEIQLESGGFQDLERKNSLTAALEGLLGDPRFAAHSLLRSGKVHRKFAHLVRDAHPERAVRLLEESLSLRGNFEDGAERLAIASILQGRLDDPDGAIDHYEQVLRNGLASPVAKERARTEIATIEATYFRRAIPLTEAVEGQGGAIDG